MRKSKHYSLTVRELGIDETSMENPLFDFTDGGDFAISTRINEFANIKMARSLMNVIVLCTQGWFRVDINGQEHTLKAGGVLICPSHVFVEKYVASEDVASRAMFLSDRLMFTMLGEKVDVWIRSIYINGVTQLELTEKESMRMEYYSALCRSIIEDDTIADRSQLLPYQLSVVIQEICRKLTMQDMGPDKKISYSKRIFYHFLAKLLSAKVKRRPVYDYAKELAVTPKYLSFVCDKFSGLTALAWIERVVMEDVRYYLRNTDMSFKEISSILGFPNNSFFGRYVLRNTGMSPSQYRKSLR